MQPPPEKFGPVAIFLHWLIAAAMVLAVVLGLIADYTDDTDLTRNSLALHQSIGATIFTLALVRVVWRLTHAAPPLPADTPKSQKIAAALAHFSLYLILFALPVTGYIGLAARGRPITIFGLFDLPNVVPHGLALSRLSQNLHDNGQYVLYALLIVHVGAALYHRLVLNDGILERMWPERKKNADTPALQSGDAS